MTGATSEVPVPPRAALASLVAACLLGVALLPLVVEQEPVARGVRFDPAPRDALVAGQPQYVFIGNSMLYSRLDRELLEEHLGAPVAFLTGGGAMSAQSYLRFKNLVAASGIRPRQVVITFRDDYLTRPSMRVDGPYAEPLQALATDDEPVLHEILGDAAPAGTASEPLGWLPTRTVRDAVDAGMTAAADRAASWLRPDLDPDARRQRVNDAFGIQHVRDDVDVEATTLDSAAGVPVFADVVERSFLPALLDVAAEHELPLTLVRVQRRRRLAQEDDSALAAYVAELAGWVEARDVTFIDLSGHPAITEDFYGEGDHIAVERRADYTRLFLQLHPGLFGPTPARPVAP